MFGFSVNVLGPARGLIEFNGMIDKELGLYTAQPLVIVVNVHGDETGSFYDYTLPSWVSGHVFAFGLMSNWTGLLRLLKKCRRKDRRIYIVAAQCCSIQFIRDLEDAVAGMPCVFVIGLSSRQSRSWVATTSVFLKTWQILPDFRYVQRASHTDLNMHLRFIAKIEMDRVRLRTDEDIISTVVADIFQAVVSRSLA